MRNLVFEAGEYYHVCHRGNNKQNIFYDQDDWTRLLFLILYFQSPIIIPNISRLIKCEFKPFVQSSALNKECKNMLIDYEDKIIKNRTVDLMNYCLIPNHLHLSLKALTDNSISHYMQRILTSYTKYINTKYDKVGHLFQGPFKAVHIEDENQLLYLSAYIHRNPREISEWKDREETYPWSSYHDYIVENRWGSLLKPEEILEQFDKIGDYKTFVDESGAKDDFGEDFEIK